MTTITAFSAKGGSGKTTLVVGLACSSPSNILVVDTDPSESAYRWLAALDLNHVQLATARSRKALAEVLEEDDSPLVLIDTPPVFESQPLVRSAVEAAAVALTPCLPSPADTDRLEIAAEIAEDEDALWRVVVNQERAWTRAGGELRDALKSAGYTPLTTGFPLREATRTAWGNRPPESMGSKFLWEELIGA